jgi:8-oxo-dGTP pyrophosphatase MutT (NUDIX family)
MADLSSTSREPVLGSRAEDPRASHSDRKLVSLLDMSLIRERVRGRMPRSALADSTLAQLAPEAPQLTLRRAAVATILRDHEELGPEVLFIRRAEHPGDPWSGHMAFPGGREEPSDADLLQTAIRETREEVALDLETNASLLGRLDELPAVARGLRTGLTITPFVFELTRDAPLHFNGEVSEIVWAPLSQLFGGELATVFPHEIGGQRIELPAHDVQGRIVWGLTHRMLESLFALLR